MHAIGYYERCVTQTMCLHRQLYKANAPTKISGLGSAAGWQPGTHGGALQKQKGLFLPPPLPFP